MFGESRPSAGLPTCVTVVNDRHLLGCCVVVVEGEGSELHRGGFVGHKSNWRLPVALARGVDLGPVVRPYGETVLRLKKDWLVFTDVLLPNYTFMKRLRDAVRAVMGSVMRRMIVL